MREADVSVSYGTKENIIDGKPENKDCSEITALERLSYMNAWARMELLNANSKLLNFQIHRDSKFILRLHSNQNSTKMIHPNQNRISTQILIETQMSKGTVRKSS